MSATIVLESVKVIKDGDDWPRGKGDFQFLYKISPGGGTGWERLKIHGYPRDMLVDDGFIIINEKEIDLGDGETHFFNKTIHVDVPGPFWVTWVAIDHDDDTGFFGNNADGGLAVACGPNSSEIHHSTVADRDGGNMKVVFNWRVTFNPMNWDDFFGPKFNGNTSVFLKCLGSVDGPRWLDGRTQSSGVGLAPEISDGFSGTLWRCRRLPDDFNANRKVVTLQCLGLVEGNRWLDAYTVDGSVYLSPANVSVNERLSGTRWEILQDFDRHVPGAFGLRCLGNIRGHQYLDGNTVNGTVRLQDSLDPALSGTRWHAFEGDSIYRDVPA